MNFRRTAAAAFFAAGSLTMTAQGAGWVMSTIPGAQGLYYYDETGARKTDGWKWIDGDRDSISECYYFDAAGRLVTGQTLPDGNTVDENGCWIVDGKVQTIDDLPDDMPSPGPAAEETAAEETAAIPPASPEEIRAYYADSLIAGDSVIEDFTLYGLYKDPIFADTKFLGVRSYSLHLADRPITAKSPQPLYLGEKRYLWACVKLMGVKRVFLFFGINDVDRGNDTPEQYLKLIDRIKAVAPETEIHILSCTYCVPGSGTANLNSRRIRALNDAMREMARRNGWGYVDLAGPTSDGNGDLRRDFCYDGQHHLNRAGFQVWSRVLQDYASAELAKQAGN